jgi:hypothetical protein
LDIEDVRREFNKGGWFFPQQNNPQGNKDEEDGKVLSFENITAEEYERWEEIDDDASDTGERDDTIPSSSEHEYEEDEEEEDGEK